MNIDDMYIKMSAALNCPILYKGVVIEGVFLEISVEVLACIGGCDND